MPDDRKNRGPEDGRLISWRQRHERTYWLRKLGVTGDLLVEAIAAVGHSAKKVRAWLATRSSG